VLFAFVVLGTMPIDWLGRTCPKWPVSSGTWNLNSISQSKNNNRHNAIL